MTRCTNRFALAGTAVVAMTAIAGYWIAREPGEEKPSGNWTQIEPGLFLGGQNERPPAGVTAVLNLSFVKDAYACDVHVVEPIADGEPSPSLEWLQKQVAFVDAQRRAGRGLLVHCDKGESRSAMVMAAYFMWRDGVGRDAAVSRLRTLRPGVRPKATFIDLPGAWERELAKERAATRRA